MDMKVSEHGMRVLDALAEGRAFRPGGDGWRAGGLRAPKALVGELARAALVHEEGGALSLTDAGRAWAERARKPARLLVERALVEEGAAPVPTPVRVPQRPARARRSVTVNLLESPLGWLKARGLVTDRQYDAGERLRDDFTRAQLGPRVTMRWDAAPAAARRHDALAPLDATTAQIAAKRRFDGAVAAAGSGMGDILWRVVCSGEGLEAAESALGWPKRAGKLVLLMALDRVADYYRLP